jgi:hypothetical protein
MTTPLVGFADGPRIHTGRERTVSGLAHGSLTAPVDADSVDEDRETARRAAHQALVAAQAEYDRARFDAAAAEAAAVDARRHLESRLDKVAAARRRADRATEAVSDAREAYARAAGD